ncbi:ABC transporter permease [Pelagibius sp.]|uniref:ABC transporter permease n=1 Tax=Pelagibius sp. TaxID=1931238 RepID=UPI003BAFB40A
MSSYILRRLINAFPTFLIVGLVAFSLVHLAPGDPASYVLGEDAPEEALNAMREQMGLTEPLPVQFLTWLANAVTGDFGKSLITGVPVHQLIFDSLEPTVMLVTFSMLVAVGIGMPLGVLSAKYRNSPLDKGLLVFSLLGVSMPNFWLGLNLILLLAVYLELLPVAGYAELSNGLDVTLTYLLMPAITLGLSQSAIILRITRTSMLEVLGEDYIRTSRAKGLAERVVLLKHALFNAMIPVLTITGTIFAVLLGGAIVVEVVFNIPGLGRLTISAVQNRDYPMIQGVLVFITLMNIVVHLGIDVLYSIIDPRIHFR